MSVAIIVLNVFAALWGIVGLNGIRAPRVAWAIPIVASGVLIMLGLRAIASLPARSVAEGARAGRVVGLWSAVEGLVIVVAVNVLKHFGMDRFIVPAVAVIVGLHFLPLSRGLGVPVYMVAGLALIVVGAAGMASPAAYALAVTGFGSAVVLWMTSAAVAFRWWV